MKKQLLLLAFMAIELHGNQYQPQPNASQLVTHANARTLQSNNRFANTVGESGRIRPVRRNVSQNRRLNAIHPYMNR